MLTKYTINYALIAVVIIVGSSALVWIISGSENYPFAWMGWGSIVILLFGHMMVIPTVYSAKKDLKTKVHFNLRAALRPPLIMVSLVSIAYAFYMAIFMNFMSDAFLNFFIHSQKELLSAKDFELFLAEMEKRIELYHSPLYHAGVSFVTSFAIGFVWSVIVAWSMKAE